MAKRRKSNSNTVYRTRTKTIRSYANRVKAKTGGIVAGIVAGAGGQLVGRFLPLGAWAQPTADIVTGHFMKNETLSTIGGRSIGAMLASGIGGSSTVSNTSGSLVG